MKRFASILLALSALCLAGCGQSGEPASAPGETQPAAAAENESRTTVRFDTMTGGVDYGDTDEDLYYYGFPSLQVSTEDGAGETVTDELNARLTPSAADLEDVTENATAAYEALDEAGRREWDRHAYGFDRSVELARCDGRILSLVVTDSRSLGAPHPSNRSFGLTYDLATGELLSSDAITGDPNALEAKVRDYILASAAENPNAESFYGLEEFAESVLSGGEWYLNESGLVAFASQEEIAPYAVGTVAFVLPYSELDGLIKSEYLPTPPEGGADDLEFTQDAEGATVFARLTGDAGIRLTARGSVTGLMLTELGVDADGGYTELYDMFYVSRLNPGESLGVKVSGNLMFAYGVEYGAGETYVISGTPDAGYVFNAA